MQPPVVAVNKPGGKSCLPLGGGLVSLLIGPLTEVGLDKLLSLTVGARGIRLSLNGLDSQAIRIR
jgi:hypothetical protein